MIMYDNPKKTSKRHGWSKPQHFRAMTCQSNGSPSAASRAPVAVVWRHETAACPEDDEGSAGW